MPISAEATVDSVTMAPTKTPPMRMALCLVVALPVSVSSKAGKSCRPINISRAGITYGAKRRPHPIQSGSLLVHSVK